jgi:hypothetical protein
VDSLRGSCQITEAKKKGGGAAIRLSGSKIKPHRDEDTKEVCTSIELEPIESYSLFVTGYRFIWKVLWIYRSPEIVMQNLSLRSAAGERALRAGGFERRGKKLKQAG